MCPSEGALCVNVHIDAHLTIRSLSPPLFSLTHRPNHVVSRGDEVCRAVVFDRGPRQEPQAARAAAQRLEFRPKTVGGLRLRSL